MLNVLRMQSGADALIAALDLFLIWNDPSST